MTEEFVRYLEMCVNFHHENDESFKIADSAYEKENLMYFKAIHYINELYNDVEENHTIEQNAGENKSCTDCSNYQKHLSVCFDCKGKKNWEYQGGYKPFKNCSELIDHCGTKLIWVIHKRYKTENLITAYDNDNESIGGSCVFIQDIWVDMKELFDNFTFCDGSPCGILEE